MLIAESHKNPKNYTNNSTSYLAYRTAVSMLMVTSSYAHLRLYRSDMCVLRFFRCQKRLSPIFNFKKEQQQTKLNQSEPGSIPSLCVVVYGFSTMVSFLVC